MRLSDELVSLMAQEQSAAWSLTNALRHSLADRVTLSLRADADAIDLVVSDNGGGRATDVAARGRGGLLGLEVGLRAGVGRVQHRGETGVGGVPLGLLDHPVAGGQREQGQGRAFVALSGREAQRLQDLKRFLGPASDGGLVWR